MRSRQRELVRTQLPRDLASHHVGGRDRRAWDADLRLVEPRTRPRRRRGAGEHRQQSRTATRKNRNIPPAFHPRGAEHLNVAAQTRDRPGVLAYFLTFLSCFGFLTSFLRTLFPLLITDSFWLCRPRRGLTGPEPC